MEVRILFGYRSKIPLKQNLYHRYAQASEKFSYFWSALYS